ncbi:MAG TPA: G5 domain-containing protein, partial [Candidatus Saccharibacteria bacterium]|nr:G5 domain-containing protein [Candidatus Saccharibacteria bacterium]
KTEPALSEEEHGADFTVNGYRARPIAVVHGANHYTVMTAERSPREIAHDAGFETKPEDQFSFQRSDDPFAGAPGTQMVIKRAKTIQFELYGTTSSLNTNATTVGGLLSERGVKVEQGDEVNLPLETRIAEGMLVSIANVNRTVETVEEVAQFAEEQIKDAQQPLGYKKVQTPGKTGKKLVTYEVVSRNGGAPERTAVKEVITEEPTKQVVVVGAKQALNVSGNCGEWIADAGITDSDAMWLIGKESGCNPGAVNRSSGACGIPQALPCSKLPCPLDATGAVCQLTWMEDYVLRRYGSWAAARAFHATRGWY